MGKERREISENSWIVKVEGIIKRNYDLNARNPNKVLSKNLFSRHFDGKINDKEKIQKLLSKIYFIPNKNNFS
jgi:hypothetical protein